VFGRTAPLDPSERDATATAIAQTSRSPEQDPR